MKIRGASGTYLDVKFVVGMGKLATFFGGMADRQDTDRLLCVPIQL